MLNLIWRENSTYTRNLKFSLVILLLEATDTVKIKRCIKFKLKINIKIII